MQPKPPRARMTGWYDPPQLFFIAIRVAISTVFGEFADRRESWSSTRNIDPGELEAPFRYAADPGTGEFWLDYIADNGDGWSPTYAIARLLADPRLTVAGAAEDLPIGRLLIMGGDQVYPMASREAYLAKLVAPFDEAARGQPWLEAPPDLYAIPGNHDWYDGLTAFLNLFCRRRRDDPWTVRREGRRIGGRQTLQSRSYFAIRLPHGWWLWGADVQLTGYIDQPQVDFFRHVSEQWMEPGSQIILCTGQPSWSFVDPENPGSQFRNFSYLERIARQARGKNHAVRLVLSGDVHHYSRYIEGGRHYVTAGGGGGFLHPTHHLVDKSFDDDDAPLDDDEFGAPRYRRDFKLAKDEATGKPALFPDRATSRRLSWHNLGFAFLNWQYSVSMGAALVFFYWLMHAQAAYSGRTLLTEIVAGPETGIGDAVLGYLSMVFRSPWGTAAALASLFAYIYLADFKGRLRFLAGLLHAIAQVAAVMLSTCLLALALAKLPADDWRTAALIGSAGGIGGFVSATVLGIYFLISLNLFGVHWNEAFSSLRIEDYKNLLRLRIHADGRLTVYPVGLAKVPDDCGETLANPPLSPHLIEAPITLEGRPVVA